MKRKEKQLYGYIKQQTAEILLKKTQTWLKKRNFTSETISLLIAPQRHAVWTNYIKVKINKTQQNSQCRLCSEKSINQILSEYSKLVQNVDETWYNCVGKVIYWESSKELDFDLNIKWCMKKKKSKSVLPIETH